MKILITADIHCGVRKRLDDCIWAMKTMRKYAAKHGIHHVFVLGDMFHDRVNLNIGVINAVYDFFYITKKEFDQEWLCFPGNHDMFKKNSWTINSLKPLMDVIKIVEDPKLIEIENHRFWILPFIHYESAYMNILNKIEEKHEEGDVLLTHIGVNSATLNMCFLIQNWSIVNFEESKFDLVYTGHFHCHQKVGRNVVYPGSPIPFRFDEGLVPHGFIVHDTDTRTWEFVEIFSLCDEHPPDYITILDTELDEYEPKIRDNNMKILLTKEYTQQDLHELKGILKNKGIKSVTWVQKQDKIDVEDIQSGKNLRVDSPSALFEAWLEQNIPDDLDKKLLLALNERIVQETEERRIVEDFDA